MNARRLCALACLLLYLPVSLLAEGLRYRVEGVEDEARDNIVAYLGESPRDEASAERFLVTARDRAGRALETLGIYSYTVSLLTDRSVDPWRVAVQVTHGDPVTYAAVDVSLVGKGADDPALLTIVNERAPKKGQALHHGSYEVFKERLQRRARERGYFDSAFRTSEVRVDAASGEASATLVFATGERLRFGPVTAPEDLLSAKQLAALKPFNEGEPYQQSLLLEFRSRLLRLGYFSSVVVLPDLTAREASIIPIAVDVQAAPRHSFEVGAGFSTDTRQRLSLAWMSPRLNRFGHSQRTRLLYSPVNPSANVLYSVPLNAGATDLLQFGARLEDNEFGDLDSVQRELSAARELSTGRRVFSYGARALNESWGALGEDFEASYLLAAASVSQRDRRGNAVDPAYGISQFYEIEAGSSALGSDLDLVRLQGSVTAVSRVGERSRLLGRITGGYLYSDSARPDELPPSLAFFAGGDNSLRGFAYQSVGREIRTSTFSDSPEVLVVGGTRLLTGTMEYQRYIRDNWRGTVFVDAGDAFVEENFDLHVGVGVGVHYLTPLGAIRLEVAYPVSEDDGDFRLHITIGAEL